MKKAIISLVLLSGLFGCGVDFFPGSPAVVTITSTTLPAATVNAAYSQTLTAFGGKAPYTWATSSGTLPAGLTLSSAGVIAGTPTTAGTSTFTVKVTDSTTPTATSATQSLTLAVAAPLAAGSAAKTLAAGDAVVVPVGTTITLNGVTTTVAASPTTVTTSAGAVVTVPATGTPTITVIAQ